MSNSGRYAHLSPLKQALLAVEEMQARLDAAEAARCEPIAIVGMGCRFPGGAVDPDTFWRLLRDGVDGIGEVPPDRWDLDAYYDPDPDAPGKMSTRWGGFVKDVYAFDALFFGISPREATNMDPQQRLLLEVAWEALENGAQSPEALAGGRTGVFIGIIRSDYSQLQTLSQDPRRFDLYYASGQAHSIASGRLSYVLGVHGPSIAVDTACSSSLVALHLACQSLRARECDLALAAGTNLVLSPEANITFSKARMMAPDGRCKTFDARADGYVAGDGCGVVVLKRLSDARRDRDNVLALVRGVAVNQDGPSSGLTAPNGPAQQALIREALAGAGIAPSEVSYVEAHGTGTSLGDPIEVQALAAVLGRDRPKDRPLAIGSVKTNFGHLEAAAGMAGLIKLVLALQHREIPPHLHLQQPNPHIPWERLPVTVPTQPTPWAAGPRKRVAGLSSFGFSGTNAHVVVEEAPEPEAVPEAVDRPAHLLALSAKSEAALVELSLRFLRRLEEAPSASWPDACFSANAGRSHFSHRLAVVAASSAEARAALEAFSAGQETARLSRGPALGPSRPKVVFLFTGQGSQYTGMGRMLYETQPTFRAALERCDELLRPHLDRRLLSVLYPGDGEASPLDQTAYTQPALFALEWSLAELWRSWGIEPALVLGHSVGEYVAACVAGVFSLEDGLKLIAERGRLMQSLPRGGEMAAVMADEARVRAAIAVCAGRVQVAAVNGPENVVISGEGKAVQAVVAGLVAERVKSRALTVSHAFHSPLMDPILDAFEAAAATVSHSAPRIGLVSNLTGRPVAAGDLTAAYWRRHVREAVRFSDSMAAAREKGGEVFLEVGPSPTLLAMGRRCLPEDAGLWLPSLRKERDDWSQLLGSLASLYVHGAKIDWAGFDRDYPRRRIALPTYPFQRTLYRAPGTVASTRRVGGGLEPAGHPLLERRLRSPLVSETVFETRLDLDRLAYLRDHQVYGRVVVAGAAYLEMANAAAEELLGGGCILEDIVIREALVLPAGGSCTLQVVFSPSDGGGASFQLISLEPEGADSAGSWTVHVTGTARVAGTASGEPPVTLPELQSRCSEALPVVPYYDWIRDCGLDLGPCFRGLERLWRREGESLARIRVPEAVEPQAGAYGIHPTLLDAGLSIVGAALPRPDGRAEPGDAYMPISLQAFRLHRPAGGSLWSHAVIREGDAVGRETLLADVRLLNDDGRVVAAIPGMQLKRTDPEALARATEPAFDDWLYEVEWREHPRAGLAPAVAAGSAMPPPREIAERVEPRVVPLAEAHDLSTYDRLMPELDRLCAAYVVEAFARLGWRPTPGESVTSAALMERLRVAGQHRRLLGRMLEMLEEDGLLAARGSAWEVIASAPTGDAEPLRADLVTRFPSGDAELTVTGRCGSKLAEVLRGECDPLGLIFPGGSLEAAERLYRESPPARVFQSLVQEAVSAAVAGVPEGRPLRLLEIGAGTGGTTSYVVPRLPAQRSEYVFTDVSPLFTARAQARFHEFPFVRYEVLDIERDPRAQGFPPHAYDVILAANVIHATRSLRETLGHVLQLLAPEGLFVLVEIASRQRWVDLTFGLLDGWWRFADTDLRPSYPLLTHPQWLALLEEVGFAEGAKVPTGRHGEGMLAQHGVVLARGPGAEAASPARGRWLVFADQGGAGDDLATRLEGLGGDCVRVSAGDSYEVLGPGRFTVDARRPEDFVRLLRESQEAGGPIRGVVHLWSLDAPPAEASTTEQLVRTQEDGCGSALHLVQALGAAGLVEAPRLWLVTRGAQPVIAGEDPVAFHQAPLWGFGKVVALEHPELRCARVDLDPAPGEEASRALLDEVLAAGDGEDQVGFRAGKRHVARLVRHRVARPARQRRGPVRLRVGQPGVLDELELEPLERRPPGRQEVEIEVHATGLNFRDVLNALGMRRDEDALGGECAGRIVAVGPEVEGLKPGDAVVAIGAGFFGSFATTGAALVAHKPEGVGFEEAATVPIAFLTAHYALNHQARMSAGERVLIHAAAGGVGMAAVQLAQRAGAEIFATAGSSAKREYLRSLGVPHVMDSRSLSFAEEVMDRTAGSGVDIVLNSLAGEFIPKSLSVLAAKGRFLEIGKSQIWPPERVGAVKRDVDYIIVDLAETLALDPISVRPMFLELLELVGRGILKPLPRRVFPMAEVVGAFRYMAQAKQIGKVVVTSEVAPAAPAVRADAAYLITGGLGGLGLEVAGWMTKRGARHLVLMGRRTPSPAQQAALNELRSAGADVEVVQGDVSSAEAVASALAASRWPLRGVFHCAGVLDDGVLLQQRWERFAGVMAPKAAGSWNLHRLTKDGPLDFFVLFSSASSLLGSPGQGNHAAANAFLDALAHHRRRQGLPAQSVNWGVWTRVGAAAERNVGQRVAVQGMGSFSPEQGIRILERLVQEGAVQVGVMPVQWPRFLRSIGAVGQPFFSELEGAAGAAAKAAPAARVDLRQRLDEAPPNQRQKLVLSHVRDQALKVLGLDAAHAVDPRQPLNELGLDSLMAVELRNLLGTGLGLQRTLPATLVFDHPSIADLADYLGREVFGLEPAARPDPPRPGGAGVLDSIEQLSEEEVDRLLDQKAAKGGP